MPCYVVGMAKARVGDGELAYDESGGGPAVVLVHAALGDRRMWDHQMQALAAEHRVVRYVWRGVGESDSPVGPVAHHEDLIGLIDALGIDKAVLMGASRGGSFALDAALAAPDRVAGLVLVCSGLSGHEWPAEMIDHSRAVITAAVPVERLRADGSRTAGEVQDEDVAAMAQAQAALMVAGPRRRAEDITPEVWNLATTMLRDVYDREWREPAVMELQLDPPAVGRLAEIQAPTLVVNGLEDLPWIQDLAEVLTAEIAGARRVDLAETAHLPSVERPVELNAAVATFLAEPPTPWSPSLNGSGTQSRPGEPPPPEGGRLPDTVGPGPSRPPAPKSAVRPRHLPLKVTHRAAHQPRSLHDSSALTTERRAALTAHRGPGDT